MCVGALHSHIQRCPLFTRVYGVWLTPSPLSVTFYEIFQERVHDLLLPPAANGGGAAKRTSLPVRTHPTKGSYIEGITTVDITSSLKVALTTIKKGFKSRATAGTEMNEQSSRSHAVVRITTTHEDKSVSHVTFVDLAGSERQRKTQTSGERLKEASAINQVRAITRAIAGANMCSRVHVCRARVHLCFLLDAHCPPPCSQSRSHRPPLPSPSPPSAASSTLSASTATPTTTTSDTSHTATRS